MEKKTKADLFRTLLADMSDSVTPSDKIYLSGILIDASKAKMLIFGAGGTSGMIFSITKLISGVLEKLDSIDKAKLKEAIMEEIFDDEEDE